MTCHYCKIFQKTKVELRRKESKNGKQILYHFCRRVGKEVKADSEPCENFRPSKYFWCNTDECWMFVVSCLNRDCHCYQKEEVKDAIRGFDIGKEFNMKPKLVLKKKEQPKPVLKLRKKKKKIILIPKKPKLVLKKKKKKTNVVLLRRK